MLSILAETDGDESPPRRPQSRASVLDASMDLTNLLQSHLWDSISDLTLTSSSLCFSSLDRSEMIGNVRRPSILIGKSFSMRSIAAMGEEQDLSFAVYSRGNLL
jgi:hypothetical protein